MELLAEEEKQIVSRNLPLPESVSKVKNDVLEMSAFNHSKVLILQGQDLN